MIKKFNFPHLIVSLTFYYSAVTLIQLFLRDCKMLTFAQGGSTKIHYVPVVVHFEHSMLQFKSEFEITIHCFVCCVLKKGDYFGQLK